MLNPQTLYIQMTGKNNARKTKLQQFYDPDYLQYILYVIYKYV